MKGLSTTILIVVTAVVILVAALVLLTIFGGGVQNVATLTQAQSMCKTEAQFSLCSGNDWNKPVTWNVPTKRIAGGPPKSCFELVDCICKDNALECTDK